MIYILGVDAGGTKTTARITDSKGNKISESKSGSGNFKSVGTEKAIENVNNAVFESMEQVEINKEIKFESSCFGFAGFDVPDDLKHYLKIVHNNILKKNLNLHKCLIVNDTRIGLEAGSDAANKLIIIAGTGSNCFGVNKSGVQAGSTGWDYLLADEGSGYSVSVKALRAIMKAYDGRGEKTLLSAAILNELGLKKEVDLIGWAYGEVFSKEKIGSIARRVCQAAYDGDGVSREILAGEADEAVLSVTTVASKLGLAGKEFDIVFVGGLFKCEKYFKDIVTSSLEDRYDRIKFKPLVANPVEGAIKLAIENL
jgi:N-acetylglucosamine kinase-like BadF-type ATPase